MITPIPAAVEVIPPEYLREVPMPMLASVDGEPIGIFTRPEFARDVKQFLTQFPHPEVRR